MELSSGKIGNFTYVPKYRGNRDLPENERLSLTIKPLRRIDLMVMAGWEDEPDQIYRWRDRALKRFIDDPEYGDLIKQIPLSVLCGMRQFVEHTCDFRNFHFGGEEKTDPIEIFLELAGELNREENLIAEIQDVIRRTATLTEDELKNWLRQCGGWNDPNCTAPSVPADKSPSSADTPPANTASSISGETTSTPAVRDAP